MEEKECKDPRFSRVAGMVADEITARLNGGQVDGTPTRRKPSLANILTLLVMAGGLLVVGWNAASEATSIRLELIAVKARQTEDRTELNLRIKEIRDDVGQIRVDMRNVLVAIGEMKGQQGSERRGR